MTPSKNINRSTTSFLSISRIFLFSIISSGLLFLTNCTSLDTLVVNVEKPAQITLPSNIDNIVIVDNSIPQAEDIGHVEYIEGQKTDTQIAVNTDSLNYILAANLFDELIDKDYFEDIIFYEHPIREDGNFEEILPLDSSLVRNLCIDNNANGVVSLDRFLVSTISNEEDFDFGTKVKYLDAKMDVRFQVYSNQGKPISPPFYINDSIYWVTAYDKDKLLTDPLPSREEAMKEAALYMAEKIAQSLVPYWSHEPRWYFGDIKAANKMMANNDWAGALALWKSTYEKETKNIKKKARLANNIALAYELSDELKEALRWITISCDLFSKTEQTSVDTENLTRATNYKDDLLTRYYDFRLLDTRKRNSQ